MDSLRWFKVPSVITDTMMLMFRYISLISEESTRIRKAQESRLGYSHKVGITQKTHKLWHVGRNAYGTLV